jgi:hypothetical protein
VKSKFFTISLLLVTSSACGGHYTMAVEPIKVEVTHKFSMADIESVFLAQCRRQLGPNASDYEVALCGKAKVADFLDEFMKLGSE